MTKDSDSLATLRRDIDGIDDALHDLLMKRAALVEKVARAKAADGTPLRPGREALVLRRLLERHSGPFPKEALVRIWREIMGALVGLQRPFSIATVECDRCPGYAELARNHFGVVWPLSLHASPGHVVRTVADGQASVGIVPVPGPEDQEPWWLALNSEAANLPRVVARLPFLGLPPGSGRGEPVEALVVACCPPEETGEDRTLLAVETAADVSRDRLRAALGAEGLEAGTLLAHRRSDEVWVNLIEIAGFVAAGDPRLAALKASGDPVVRATVIGGYAQPLTP